MRNKEESFKILTDLFDFNFKINCIFRKDLNSNGKDMFEITSRQFELLMALDMFDNISALENFFNISKSSLSLTISKMESNGLVEKNHFSDESDKRIVRIRRTEKGEKITEKFKESLSEIFYNFYSKIDDEQYKNLKKGTEHLKYVFNSKEE